MEHDDESFILTAIKIRRINEMRSKVQTRYTECCPVLEDCIEQVHSCYLPEYASLCHYRRLKTNKVQQVNTIKNEKPVVQKCKRR